MRRLLLLLNLFYMKSLAFSGANTRCWDVCVYPCLVNVYDGECVSFCVIVVPLHICQTYMLGD